MKKIQFPESQIVKAIQEDLNGRKEDDLCRERAMCTSALYERRQK